MKLSPKQTAKERGKLTRSRAFRAHEKQAGYVAVCLIGPEHPIPRKAGDNLGGLPVRVVVTAKDRTAAKDDDLAQPYHKFIVLECVHVESRVHGDRLKAALDEQLLGAQTELDNDQPRHRFRDVRGCFDDEYTRSIWWGIVLDSALREVKKQARKFDVFDAEEKQRRISEKVRRGR